jgi:hypothetical protein
MFCRRNVYASGRIGKRGNLYRYVCVRFALDMDVLRNASYPNGTLSRFLQPIRNIVRWDELICSDPNISLQKTQLPNRKTEWTITKLNASPSDSGYVEQIHLPHVHRLGQQSVKFVHLSVV